jgi:hypothetical protein
VAAVSHAHMLYIGDVVILRDLYLKSMDANGLRVASR